MQPDFEGIEMREIRHKRLTRGAACAWMKNKQRKGEWRMDRFDVAAEMIREAGEVLRRCRLEQTEIRQKTDHRDLVTFWDRKIERQLRRTILTAFPRDSIVGEEYPTEESCGGKVTWYLDPIDGTTNFINQHRNYAVSVGCWEGTTPLFGLVLDVERQDLYWARRGGGAPLSQCQYGKIC